MEKIFSKKEVLISCSSLKNLELNKCSLGDSFTTSLKINDKLAKLLIDRINNLIEENASRMAERTIKKYGKGTDINELITEILLARRYRAGRKEERIPSAIYKKVQERIKKSLPIRLTFSLFPCKIPNLLKSGGVLADLGDLASLARMKEVALAVKKVYQPGLQMIILQDGYRFKNILNFPDFIIDEYQKTLLSFHKLLKAEEFIVLENYTEVLNSKIGPKKLAEKEALFKKTRVKYQKEFGEEIDVNCPLEYLDAMPRKVENKELVKKFISLYMSLIYCSYIPEIMEAADRDKLSLEVFSDVFNFKSQSSYVNKLRKKTVSETWHYALDYISEITAGRIIKPIEIIYPDSIRCDMHNIKGRLTLYPVNRSTKLSSFHSTGYINQKGRINVNFRVLLNNRDFLPIYGFIFGVKYYPQAFGYISKKYLDKFKSRFTNKLINSLLLK